MFSRTPVLNQVFVFCAVKCFCTPRTTVFTFLNPRQPCPCPVVSPLPAHERCTAYLPWESTSCSSQCTPILLPVLRILQLVNTDASCGGRHDAAVAGPYVRPEVLQAMMDKAYGNWQAPGAQQPSFGVGVPAAGFRHNRYTGPRWGAGGNSARRHEW